MWRRAWRLVGRHHELALVAIFFAAAGWELVEVLTTGPSRRVTGALPIVLHSVQVLIVVGVTWAVFRAWRQRTRYEAALATMVEQNVMAQEEERRRIAFDLHDGIAPLIVSAKQHVDTGRDLAARDPSRADHEIARAADRLDRAIVETRRVLQALRPSAVASLGLAEAARRALDDAGQEAGWATRFVAEVGDARMPAAVETAAFRIVQEGLANAARHAASTLVEVALRRRDGWLDLEVSDNGVGIGPDGAAGTGRGLGLAGMRERTRLLGGTFQIDSVASGGTHIRVALPLGAGAGDGAGG
jgi:signal transduction histidine kinase